MFGGTRPPVPITVGVGSGLPLETTATTGLVSSVSVRLVALERNSVTLPTTLTSSPTLTPAAADAPKT